MGPCTASSCCCQAPKSAMGPCTASSCCCQVQSLSWVPVRPPICCSIATLCHFRSPHTLLLFPVMLLARAFQVAAPLICHGPPVFLHAAARSQCLMGAGQIRGSLATLCCSGLPGVRILSSGRLRASHCW
ncbi:unnamed protein product, partial [Staurois parvus]